MSRQKLFLLLLVAGFFIVWLSVASANCSGARCDGEHGAALCDCPAGSTTGTCCRDYRVTNSSGQITGTREEYYACSCPIGGDQGIGGVTNHCWRQDIARPSMPNLTLTGIFVPTSGEYDLIAQLGSTIRYSNFGTYNYACDDGVSGNAVNYVDLYENNGGNILTTNDSGTDGPDLGGNGYCVTASNEICYRSGSVFVPAQASCHISTTKKVGLGQADRGLEYSFASPGYLDLRVRLGAISPAGVGLYSPEIMHRDLNRLRVFAGIPSLLVFGQQKLKRLNSFESNGTITEEVFFTLLNKSPFTERIQGYAMKCSSNVTCAASSGYTSFKLFPGQAMVINGTITFEKSKIPASYTAELDLNYSADGVTNCDPNRSDSPNCSTQSVPMVFESGLLDQQDFQVEISKESEANYCIAEDGTAGKTGESVAPRVNLFFGGAVSPSASGLVGPLISVNECSPIDYNTQAPNPNWVYCSQREFLVQLAERIGRASTLRTQIKNLESVGKFSEAKPLKLQEAKLLGFTAYLRKQGYSTSTVNDSLETINSFIFTKLGLSGDVFGNDMDRFKNLINSINFSQTIGGVKITTLDLSPGYYTVSVDMNELEALNDSSSYLFATGTNEVNPSLKLVVSFEKIPQSIGYDWFFYYDETTDSFMDLFTNLQTPSKYVTNVFDRGTVLEYTMGAPASDQKFYKTFATPLMLKVSSSSVSGLSDANYTVENYTSDTPSPYDTFTYWTGFASSQLDGCETTALNPPLGMKSLPYRIPDVNIVSVGVIQNFEIPELKFVKKDSNIYLESVLYLPKVANSNKLKITTSNRQLFNSSGICTGPTCNLTINDENPTHSSETLAEVFENIKNESICVYKDSGTGNTKWRLFWNQQRILQDLNTMKNNINDAKLCELRSILSS